jgi:hypothetical protein
MWPTSENVASAGDKRRAESSSEVVPSFMNHKRLWGPILAAEAEACGALAPVASVLLEPTRLHSVAQSVNALLPDALFPQTSDCGHGGIAVGLWTRRHRSPAAGPRATSWIRLFGVLAPARGKRPLRPIELVALKSVYGLLTGHCRVRRECIARARTGAAVRVTTRRFREASLLYTGVILVKPENSRAELALPMPLTARVASSRAPFTTPEID